MRLSGATRTHARLARHGLAAVLACGAFAGALAAPASAETNPPTLTTLTLAPDTVNTSTSARTVTIDITATDDFSGIHVVRAGLKGPTGVQFDTSFFGEPSTGTPTNGTWRLDVTLPQYSPQGTYELTVELVDGDGNTLTLTPADLTALGVPSLVVQEAAGDVNPPALNGLSLAPVSVDTSNGDKEVELTVAGLDDLSGIELIGAKLTGPGATVIAGGSSGSPDSGTPTNGSWTVPISMPQGSPAGTYMLSIELTDSVGHVTAVSSSELAGLGFPNSVENMDVSGPSLSIQSGPNGPTNVAAPTFTFTSEAGSALQCSIDQEGPGFAPCSTGSSHTAGAPLADGDWTFRVRATDAATNVTTATRSFTVDTATPETQIDSGPDGLITTAIADFAFASEPGAGFECRLDGGAFGTCGSPQSYSSLADGDHSFDVRAVDPAGNVDPSPASRAFSVQAAAPTVTITSGPEGITTNPTPAFGFLAYGGSTVECSFDQGSPAFGPCTTHSSATPAAPLTEGNWTFRVRATGAGGRSTTATRSFTLDFEAPNTVIESGPAAKTFQKKATFTFSAEGAAAFECKFDKIRWHACGSPAKYKKLKKGPHKFKVRAIDESGHVEETPAKVKFKVVLLSL